MIGGLGLATVEETPRHPPETGAEGSNPFASIIPLLAPLPGSMEHTDYLVAKGLPTLPMKLVEKVWNLEYVDMEEFLPTPRSLRLAEQGRPSTSLQESLVGGFSQFQAQQQQKSQKRVTDILT